MTVERLPHIEYQVEVQELVQLLARPEKKDPRLITDPIALYGTKPLSPDAAPRSPMPGGMAFAG
jgi:hypothetical protein